MACNRRSCCAAHGSRGNLWTGMLPRINMLFVPPGPRQTTKCTALLPPPA
ncbi:hypothetical protein ACOMHN_034001 [Nucella lapillus]